MTARLLGKREASTQRERGYLDGGGERGKGGMQDQVEERFA